MEDEVVEFWRVFEEETGERVVAKSLGELCEGNGHLGVWCLVVLTDRSLWFKQVPSDNWVTSLFRLRIPSASSRRTDERALKIPCENLLSLTEPGPRRWFSRPAFPVLNLTWQEGETIRSLRCSMDPSANLLPQLLERFQGKKQQPRQSAPVLANVYHA